MRCRHVTRAVVAAAAAFLVPGCGGGLSADDREFALDLARASLAVESAMAPFRRCIDLPCAERVGPVAARKIDAQIARVEGGLETADSGCLRQAANRFLRYFQIERKLAAAGVPEMTGAAARAELRAASLFFAAAAKLSNCPGVRTA